MSKLKSILTWYKDNVILVLSGLITLMYVIIKVQGNKIDNLKADKSLADTKQEDAVAKEQLKELDKTVKKEEDYQKGLKKEEAPAGATYYNKKYGDDK